MPVIQIDLGEGFPNRLGTSTMLPSRDRERAVRNHGGSRVRSSPGIDQFHAAIGKIAQIACRNRGAVRAGNCRDLAIELPDWLASPSSRCRDRRENLAGVSIERQHVIGEPVFKHLRGSVIKCVAPPPVRHDLKTKENLGLSNRRSENSCRGMGSKPFRDPPCRRDFHHFGDDVRIQDYHSSNLIGSPTGLSGNSGKSTPPSGSNNARIDSARLGSRSPVETPIFKISLASSSIDRPCRAARTRSRFLTASSNPRIVMVAMLSMLSLIAL